MSPAESECEQLFSSNVSRDITGRYCTALPFIKSPKNLGNSRSLALRRLFALENKLKDRELRSSYNNVIQEYIDNQYLSEIPSSNIDCDTGYYIPHHPVIRQDKVTTKIRIVLDASAKCHNGVSLNDILHAGPNLQSDIFILLLNFRLFPIANTADIKQMYLQISVINEHKKYQKILFRFNTDEPIREFQFNRVAFALKSSPYLAMCTVRQLCMDEKDRFPRAASVASQELYMDDLATSIPSLEEAKVLSNELIALFKAGKFELTKWASNSSELINCLPQSYRASIDFSGKDNLKILGLKWVPSDDNFCFTTSQIDENCTKRSILSAIARLWDVLGFAAPVILFAKLLIKELWSLHIDWDDKPPFEIISLYTKFKEQLPLLSSLRIPRHVSVTESSTVNIVGFSDASLKAYGTVIYIHVTDAIGNIHVSLLCAKSKVAPVKLLKAGGMPILKALRIP
ncbi:hypothetical protein K1T71_015167 [Dendrolimus kikuchii]|nr:hypothetical protein K1T71_015167 [Dendrolimus kikuchii]